MTVCIVDYGSGNLRSAAKAFERAARENGLRRDIHVTDRPDLVRLADHVVLPGVGAFADCRAGLGRIPGMIEALGECVIDRARPFLGICVGMQLMAETGREHGDCAGLNWIGGEVVRIEPDDPACKVPHMGWNVPRFADHPVFAGLAADAHVYFVHSYHFVPADPAHRIATVDFAQELTAAVGRDNLIGTQFHPEKSQRAGQTLIANFLRWTP